MQEESVERRIVSVLFADLVGFTTLSEQYDAEDVAAIQDRYFAAVRETIGRYGGRLEKFIGDAAMAVFGVPRSRDDDAERAVRSGLALIHAVEQIGAELGLADEALRLRVGINTGEAVIAAAGVDEGRVTGDTVNTAARLQTAAPPGGVLIGETTSLAVADVADLEAVPPLDLKGKAGPTPAWLVTGFRPQASREQAMGSLRAPTLGREREIDELLKAVEGALAGATGRWLIVAPPGVGKSRLLRELAERISQLSTVPLVWRARARPDSVSPFDPVAGLLLDTVGDDHTTAEATLLEALGRAGASEARARVVTDACLALGWPSAADLEARPSDDRATAFRAWLEGFDALASGRAQVWLFEDVHWAGGDVLAFLDAATTAGRLVLATARPSLLETQAEWAAADRPAGRHTLQLATLEPTNARELVRALIGDALPADLVERIAERSDGNCLFIEELLRTWVSVGTLVADEGGWRLAVPADEVALPASVQSIYAAQLDDLPPDARRLARRASVAGRRFPLGALEPLGAQADGGLEPLRRRELVSGPVSEPLFGDAYAYRHALLRDAGYASLARAERARLHVRLARWLEQAAGTRGAEVAEQIAGHYAAALESAPALAREIDDGLDRDAVRVLAADWYERAGQGTLALSAHDAARQLFRRALDMSGEEASLDKARRWERLGDATAFAADMDEGAAAYRTAVELYREAMAKGARGFDRGSAALEQASDTMAAGVERLARLSPEGAEALAQGAAQLRAGAEQVQAGKADFERQMDLARSGLARATASLSDVMYQQLRFAESRQLADEVAAEIGEGDPASSARLLVASARGTLGAEGPSPAAEADMERALELARASGDRRIELQALSGLTMIRSESGHDDPEQWRVVARDALELGDWGVAVSASINSAITRLDDEPSEIGPALEEARQTAAAHGLTEDVGWVDYVTTEAAFVRGDWDLALATGLRVLDLAEANAYLRLAVRTIHMLIPIGAVRGRLDILERAARWYAGLEGKFEFPDSPYSRVIRTAQDVELAAHGLWTSYVPEVEPRIASFNDPTGPSWSAALDRVVRAWLDAGEVDGARRAVEYMATQLPRLAQVSTLGRGTYELLRGRVALAAGETGQAGKAGEAALEHFRSIGAAWWMAKAIRLLERAGAANDELVREAIDIERRLGAVQPTA